MSTPKSLPGLSSFDIMHLSSELRFLEGARVNKIYQPAKNVFYFVLHVPSKGRFVLSFILPKLAFVSSVRESSGAPSGFCMALRKRLVSSRIRSVSQVGFDRILKITFEKESSFSLFVELFSKGNLLLADSQSGRVLLSVFSSSSRGFRPGSLYSAPDLPADPRELSFEDFLSLYSPDSMLEKWLASSMSLGKKYAREVCFSSSLEPSSLNLTSEALRSAYDSIKSLFSREFSPNVVVSKAGELISVSPVFLEHLSSGNVVKYFDSFSSAISFAVYNVLNYASVESVQSPIQNKLEKQLKMIEMQKERVGELLAYADENSRLGELIYENYQILKPLLDEIRSKRKELSSEDFISFLKSNKLVSSFDLKNHSVTIRLP